MADDRTLVDLNAAKARKRHYETIVVVSPTVNEKAAKETADKNAQVLTDAGATILRQDAWGKKRLPHPMEKHNVGNFFYFRYIGTADAVRAVERSLKLDATILRYISVRLSEALTEAQVADLVERAPKENSSAPSVRNDDDDYGVEANISH